MTYQRLRRGPQELHVLRPPARDVYLRGRLADPAIPETDGPARHTTVSATMGTGTRGIKRVITRREAGNYGALPLGPATA